ncbi:hypothetical protein SV7mr_25010 [Stieleria bergensis]|uniref:Uncharacterized protein n=1 Tax=Stieleria bergensis TaxID=2528025 RepID=A0A517SV29_9BACT|nr:hypothetical protein SV7mr_25010 [Planctomycetes bacterium SV_7m_r]
MNALERPLQDPQFDKAAMQKLSDHLQSPALAQAKIRTSDDGEFQNSEKPRRRRCSETRTLARLAASVCSFSRIRSTSIRSRSASWTAITDMTAPMIKTIVQIVIRIVEQAKTNHPVTAATPSVPTYVRHFSCCFKS